MKSSEQHPNQSETVIAQPEMAKIQLWETYLQQLGQQFQVDLSQVGTSLKLGLADQRLFVTVGRSYLNLSHGEASTDGLTPDAEISFAFDASGQLFPSEIVYTDEVWEDFQEQLRQANQPPSDEQSFDGERFAVYLLYKISQEGWSDADHLVD